MQEDTQKECGGISLFSVSSPENYTAFSNLNQSYNTQRISLFCLNAPL